MYAISPLFVDLENWTFVFGELAYHLLRDFPPPKVPYILPSHRGWQEIMYIIHTTYWFFLEIFIKVNIIFRKVFISWVKVSYHHIFSYFFIEFGIFTFFSSLIVKVDISWGKSQFFGEKLSFIHPYMSIIFPSYFSYRNKFL